MDSTTRNLVIAFGVFLVVTLSFSALMRGMMDGPVIGPDQIGPDRSGRA